jgi:hypothetical protein
MMADELCRDYKEGGIRMRITNDRIVTTEDDDSRSFVDYGRW